jgi:hypothetical protein
MAFASFNFQWISAIQRGDKKREAPGRFTGASPTAQSKCTVPHWITSFSAKNADVDRMSMPHYKHISPNFSCTIFIFAIPKRNRFRVKCPGVEPQIRVAPGCQFHSRIDAATHGKCAVSHRIRHACPARRARKSGEGDSHWKGNCSSHCYASLQFRLRVSGEWPQADDAVMICLSHDLI